MKTSHYCSVIAGIASIGFTVGVQADEMGSGVPGHGIDSNPPDGAVETSSQSSDCLLREVLETLGFVADEG